MKIIQYVIITLLIVAAIMSVIPTSADLVISDGFCDWEANANGEYTISGSRKVQMFRPLENNIARVNLSLRSDAAVQVRLWITNAIPSGLPDESEIIAQDNSTTYADNAYHWISFDFYYPVGVETPNVNHYLVAYAEVGTHVYWQRADNCYFSGSYTGDSSYDLWFQTFYDDNYPIFIDQGDVDWPADGQARIDYQVLAQSFRPAQDNVLKVELNLKCATAENITLWVSSSSSLADTLIQVNGTTVADGSYHWVIFDFTGTPVELNVDDLYYLIATAPDSSSEVHWQLSSGDSYTRGSYFGDLDFSFHTYADIVYDAANYAPEIELISPAWNNTACNSGTVINLTITGGNGTMFYNWDGAVNQTVADTTDPILPVGDGSHVLKVYVSDIVDNWGYTTLVFITDDAAPVITLISPTNNSVQNSGVEIDLNVTDASPDGYMTYHWDDDSNQTNYDTFNPSLPVDNGEHVLHVYVTDEVGNAAFETFVFITDDVAPVIMLISPLEDSTHQSGTVIDLNITDASPDGYMTYHWDDGVNQTVVDITNLTLPALDGEHILYIYVTDEVGNAAFASYTFTTDDTAPVITLNSPTNNSIQDAGTIIDLSITDETGTMFYLWDDGSSNQTISDTTQPSLSSEVGQHVLHVYAVDSVGNWAHQVYVFTVEAPPSTSSAATSTSEEANTSSSEETNTGSSEETNTDFTSSPGFTVDILFLSAAIASAVVIKRYDRN